MRWTSLNPSFPLAACRQSVRPMRAPNACDQCVRPCVRLMLATNACGAAPTLTDPRIGA